ncbi:hypothetical protein ACWDOP_09065 [Nocardia sp. NPDC003693]
MTESVRLARDCGRCGVEGVAVIREVLDEDARWWSLAGECLDCGNESQESEFGRPPAGLREALLAGNGASRLRIAAGSISVAGVMRVLRRGEALSVAEARIRAGEVMTEGVAGTRVEVEVLARLLRADGARVEIEAGHESDSAAEHSELVGGRTVAAPHRVGEQAEAFEGVPGTLSADDARRLLRYLRSGVVIVVAASRRPDPFALGRPGARVGIGVVTDGEWVWGLEWEDFVGAHLVAPPAEFVAHATARGWIAAELPEERVLEIGRGFGMPDSDE